MAALVLRRQRQRVLRRERVQRVLRVLHAASYRCGRCCCGACCSLSLLRQRVLLLRQQVQGVLPVDRVVGLLRLVDGRAR